MAQESSSMPWLKYTQVPGRDERLKTLARIRSEKQSLPIALSEDILCLDIGNDEKQQVIELTGSRDNLAMEHFLTASLGEWNQDLAALAIRTWSDRTQHLLWARVAALISQPHLPQRVLYTIVDHAFHTGGAEPIASAAAVDGIDEMSDAFHGLLLHRAVQWGVRTPQLDGIAARTMSTLSQHLHPDNKAVVSAVVYLARFNPRELSPLLSSPSVSDSWRGLIHSICDHVSAAAEHVAALVKAAGKPPKNKPLEKLMAVWVPVYLRHHVPAETIGTMISHWYKENSGHAVTARPAGITGDFAVFAGCDPAALESALAAVSGEDTFADAVCGLHGLTSFGKDTILPAHLKSRLQQAQDPGALLARLPLRLRLMLTGLAGSGNLDFEAIAREESALRSGKSELPLHRWLDYSTESSERQTHDIELGSRKEYFRIATGRNAAITGRPAGDGYFCVLAKAWLDPGTSDLDQLAQKARHVTGIFRISYINTLGRFAGRDQAVLKLLDFIRTSEEDELRAVIHALGGIGTTRAAQELVACLTRPNITPALQFDVCAILQKLDVSGLQAELRSAVQDLKITPDVDSGRWDIRDAITSLITPVTQIPASDPVSGQVRGPSITGANTTGNSDQQLDQALAGRIPHYRDLSSEVKRALRTSLFFHMQVSGTNAPESIDLSPVIDMQYKALELLFRETFEEMCSRVIQKGVLQRRLDVIGYARPIPRAMDEFEGYVAALPVIREIPFFSKFKLRKMLRAICQFRPGRRFTLDGLKAFALFFLCFSRTECRYSLNGIFPLGFDSDQELFEFCRVLHVMQDFRNRAAHEGFHPDASNDIDGIWRQTAEIIQGMHKALKVSPAGGSDKRPVHQPVIEKKVS